MHTIQSVSERTGLTPDVIRIWERRYQVVSPHRTAANQRLYSEADVERLSLLKLITDSGRRISAIANLSNQELHAILESQPAAIAATQRLHSDNPGRMTTDAIDAILQLDPLALEAVLERAMVAMGSVGFLMQFASPLLQTVGHLWRSGAVRTSQEHFASAHLRSFLGRYILDANTDPNGPRIVVATLPGQAHELGATMASVIAAQGGWNVIYLGPNVPEEEIAFSADCKDARAVGISISYPMDDPRVPVMLADLKQKLPEHCTLIVGGAAASHYRKTLQDLDAWEASDLVQLASHLDKLRNYNP